MLRLENVTFGYRRGASVLDSFTMDVPSCRSILLGPNGAGKSTLMQILCRGLRPDRGAVSGLSEKSIGYMPQFVRALAGVSVLDQVAYCAWLKGYSARESQAISRLALQRVQLTDKAAAASTALSGGQLRRVGLAQALVGDSEMLLLDEPTAGLDPAQRETFSELVTALNVPVLVATHQIEDLSRTYEHVLVLAEGRLRFSGSVGEFLDLDASGDRSAHSAYRVAIGLDRAGTLR